MPWLELFYDLALVGAVMVMADDVLPDSSAAVQLWQVLAAACFGAIWTTMTLAFNKYPITDDRPTLTRQTQRAIRRMMVFVQVVCLVFAAIAADQNDAAVSPQVGLMMVGIASFAACITFIISPRMHSSRSAAMDLGAGCLAVAGAAMFAAIFSPMNVQIGLVVVAVALMVAAAVAAIQGDRAPIYFGHLEERFGLIVIIVLGESFLGLALHIDEGFQIAHIPLFVLALLFPMAVFEMYFRRPAPITSDRVPSVYLWLATQFVLVVSIGAVAHNLSYSSVDENFVDLPGATEQLTIRMAVMLAALAVLCLIGRHTSKSVITVYLSAAGVIAIIGIWDSRQPTPGQTALIAQTLTVLVAAVVSSLITGREKRLAARAS